MTKQYVRYSGASRSQDLGCSSDKHARVLSTYARVI